MHDRTFRCSRCAETKPESEFAPSQRTQGAYCRTCSSEYNRAYRRSHPGNRLDRERGCRRCGVRFVRWDTYRHPGSAATHCRDCYNAKARERSQSLAARRPRQPLVTEYVPGGPRPKGRRWDELRAQVFAEESVCWICQEPVSDDLVNGRPGSRHRSVDHVVPLALGGDFWDRANLRLAHMGCNSKRGMEQWSQHHETVRALLARIAQLEAVVAAE